MRIIIWGVYGHPHMDSLDPHGGYFHVSNFYLKENRRPTKEQQMAIASNLGLELATVSNFFMNARRRSMDKWQPGCDMSPNGMSANNMSTNMDRNSPFSEEALNPFPYEEVSHYQMTGQPNLVKSEPSVF